MVPPTDRTPPCAAAEAAPVERGPKADDSTPQDQVNPFPDPWAPITGKTLTKYPLTGGAASPKPVHLGVPTRDTCTDESRPDVGWTQTPRPWLWGPRTSSGTQSSRSRRLGPRGRSPARHPPVQETLAARAQSRDWARTRLRAPPASTLHDLLMSEGGKDAENEGREE